MNTHCNYSLTLTAGIRPEAERASREQPALFKGDRK
jgi:hypothetical protein